MNMVELLKKVLKSQMFGNLVAVAVVSSLTCSMAHAVAGTQNISTLITNQQYFEPMITLAFGLAAAFKWFEYFAGFTASSAIVNAITPGVLTFLTFQWDTVMGWFQL